MAVLIVILSLLALFPAGFYALNHRTDVWGVVCERRERRGAGVYRQAEVGIWKRGAAPVVVRFAAFTSFVLGQMVIPGVFVAFIALLLLSVWITDPSVRYLEAVVIGVAAPSGMVIAGWLLAAGASMLQRDAGAARTARTASTWALVHNLALIAALWLVALVPRVQREEGVAPFFTICAVICVAQALLLRRAATALDAYDRRQERERADAPAIEG